MEHTNFFNKGMNKDFNIVLQPDGTYRHMVNCSLISQDGNNYVIKDCLGNLKTFTINPPYSGTFSVIGALPMPIGFISFPDKLIVFSTNYESSTGGGYGEIGMIKYLPYGEGVQPLSVTGEYNAGYVPLYHSVDLLFNKIHQIEGFGFTENELIERVYWSDNFNEPRVFNISDPIFTNYFASGTLVSGEMYMILEGAITHGAVDYGPGLTAGNFFTASGAAYTNLTGTAPTPKVIQYFPPSLLDWTPSRTLGNITFDEFGSGSLFCGSKVYFYRLGLNSGYTTTWSYGSAPVAVGTASPYTSGVPYHDYVGAGTLSTLFNSTLSAIITIENIDTDFNFIEVACAEFDQTIDVPRQITIIANEEISGTTMSITHSGTVNLGALTIGDITLFPASILKVKTLATNKNFNLIANIEEREEFELANVLNYNCTAIQYPMLVHRDADDCSLSGMIYTGVSPTTGANPAAGAIYPNSRWLVTVGVATVNTVTYNGTVYLAGQVITGVTGAGNDTITFAGTGAVRPCVTRNRYTPTAGGRVENAIEIKGTNPANTCFWDYRSAAASHHVAGYWSDEIYRFGLLLYDLKGNPFYVKHLLDMPVPEANFKSGLIRSDVIGNTGNLAYSLNPTILSFDGITFTEEEISKISGFSIVRAERDAKIICQGLVTQNSIDTVPNPDVYHAGAWIPMSLDGYAVAPLIYTFLSPDLQCEVPLKGTPGVIGSTMENASWIDAYNYGGGVRVRGSGPVGSEQVYSKIITQLTADGVARTGTVTYWNEVSEGDTLSDLGSGLTYENKSLTAAANVDVEGACVTAGVDYTLNAHEAIGCKKTVFKLAADFLHYGPSANNYTSVAANAQTEKLLMNNTRTGFTNPYGGTGVGALANTLYISTGHYQPITTAVKAAVFNGGSNTYIFNDVEVGGGDCYTCLADIGYELWDTNLAPTFSYAWTFPCECNSNYNLRRGRKTSNVEMWYTGVAANANNIVFESATALIQLEDYAYNEGYSTEGQSIVYPALPANFVNSNEFRFRIRYAGPKFIGEVVDSFRTFSLLNFKDLAGQNGEINNIRVKKDTVVVWQDLAINTVPVLERQVVSSTSGNATTIGTGGVVDRFDIINSYFGNQHQWSVTETEFGFIWFDMHRKAVVILSFDGGGIIEIGHLEGMKSYLDEAFVEIIGSQVIDSGKLLNSPTFEDSSDRPITGVGITGVYDPKFKMAYLFFKFKGQKKLTISGSPVDAYMSKDFTIGILHNSLQKFFVSFYDWFPGIAHNHNQIVISCNNPKNTTQFLAASGTNTGLSFVVGETYPVAYDEYICILDVTLDNVAKYPTGASGSTYWTKINSTNEVWVNNQPTALGQTTAPDYLYSKFFGRVVSSEVQVVVNPQSPNPFSVLNIEQEGNSVNFTDIYTSGATQTASDTNIKSWNRFYRIIYDKICSSLPLSTTGRITDSYLLIRFVKKNWDTVPTTLTVGVKIFRWLKSFMVQKR